MTLLDFLHFVLADWYHWLGLCLLLLTIGQIFEVIIVRSGEFLIGLAIGIIRECKTPRP